MSAVWSVCLIALAASAGTGRAASLISVGREGWLASGTRYVVIRDLDPENSGADCDGHWSVDSIGFYTGANLARAPRGYYICNRGDYNIADNREACGAAECHGVTTDGCPGWNSSMTGAQIGYVGVDFGHTHVINGFKIKQRAGCGTSMVQLVHGHECGGSPCSTGGQVVATFALNRAGGEFEDVTQMWLYTNAPTAPTAAPSASPSSSRPTATPTPRPVVNTVGDCGRHHVACDGQLGSPYRGSDITCPAPVGNLNGRCFCVGPYHCRGTEARGSCADPRDHCFERGITGSPTTLPTVQPTDGPTTVPPTGSPTASPSDSPSPSPSPSPTPSPTLTPTPSPTPTPTPNPTPSPTVSPTTALADSASTSASTAAGDSGGAIVAVVIVAVVLILGVVLGAFFYVKSSLAKTADAQPGGNGFSNPAYDSSPAIVGGAQQTAGYADVPAPHGASGVSTGYMDVAPGGSHQASGYMDVVANDDEAEDV